MKLPYSILLSLKSFHMPSLLISYEPSIFHPSSFCMSLPYSIPLYYIYLSFHIPSRYYIYISFHIPSRYYLYLSFHIPSATIPLLPYSSLSPFLTSVHYQSASKQVGWGKWKSPGEREGEWGEKESVSEGENGREGGKLSWKLNDNRKLFKFVMSRPGSTNSFFLIVSMMMYITWFFYWIKYSWMKMYKLYVLISLKKVYPCYMTAWGWML